MPGDEWNVTTLRAYFESMLAQWDKRVNDRLDAMDKAVNKAEAAADKRFEGVNEFRSQLADQQRTFIPRAEYESIHGLLTSKVDRLAEDLREHIAASAGSSKGMALGWSYAIGAIGLIVGITLALVGYALQKGHTP
jgi:hypothetical protein